MEYITLKNSNLKVSRLCMGGCPMGGYGWGNMQEHEHIEAVHAALDKEVNFFDTADTYGLGQSEITLGKSLGDRRNQAIISSKFGVRVENGKTFYDNSPKWIKTALENSLRRLHTDYIDLYQVHYRDGLTSIDTVFDTLEDLKKKGYIRYYGMSNIHQKDMLELEKQAGRAVSFQNEYSLACRKNERDFFVLRDKLNLTPLTWGSLGQGVLTGKYGRNVSFGENDRRSKQIYINFHGDKLEKNLTIVERLRVIAQEVDKPVSAVAIRWILDYMQDSAVIVGIKRPEQLLGNIQAIGWKLKEKQLRCLEEVSREEDD